MINILIISFLTVFFHLCTGKIFSKSFQINNNNYYDLCLSSLLGLIILSFISLFINFFFPLNSLVNTIILILIIILLLLKNNDFIKDIKSKIIIKYISISSLSVFMFLIFNKIYNPDAGLYHFPYINILNENKIILGISNLHQRFGHISIMQYLSAIHYNYLFGLNGIVVPLASIAVYSIFFFLTNTWSKRNLSISNIFSILIILFICWKMNRYSEYGNDAPAHFIFFIIVQLYLNHKEKFSNMDEPTFFLISFFSLFAFLNKTFLIYSMLIPLICLNKKKIFKFLNLKFIFLCLFFISWITKNVLTSGCMIYPIPSTCMDLDWTNFDKISNVYDVSIGSEAWSKDWINQKNNILSYKDFLKNFYWVSVWLENHFLKISSIIIPYLFFILVFIAFLVIMKKKRKKTIQFNLKKLFLIWAIILFALITWFIKAPLFRYGYSYIISFIALTCAFFISLKLKNFIILNEKKISTVIVSLALLVLTLKQTHRIYKNYSLEYYNDPWPKYFSYDPQNYKIKIKKIYKNNIFYYYAPKKTYCFYSKSPCTSVEVDNNLKYKINSYNYKVYYF